MRERFWNNDTQRWELGTLTLVDVPPDSPKANRGAKRRSSRKPTPSTTKVLRESHEPEERSHEHRPIESSLEWFERARKAGSELRRTASALRALVREVKR